jgi:hypothetical protein
MTPGIVGVAGQRRREKRLLLADLAHALRGIGGQTEQVGSGRQTRRLQSREGLLSHREGAPSIVHHPEQPPAAGFRCVRK